MLKQIISLSTILSLLVACSNNKVTKNNTENLSEDTTWVTVTPKNYLDFEYSEAIAFATVDPFDYSDLYYSKTIDLSKFHDTISILLNSDQVQYLNDILSGRHRKPHPNSGTEYYEADCFYPRHNIIFLDKKDSIVNFISICFECANSKESKSFLADMDNMRLFFESIGLKVFDRPDHYKQYYDSVHKSKKRNN